MLCLIIYQNLPVLFFSVLFLDQPQMKPEQRSMWQAPRCHPIQDYHTVIPFQHKRSTKQAKHETKNKQKATKIQKLKHLAISIEII